jgi:putative colanic acid biosynthesis acetyltransferase WcaF
MILSHSSTSTDAYKRASFSTSDKIRRLIWQITWLLLCRWSPKPIHSWRVIILRFFGAKIGESNFIYPSCKIWAPWLLETEDVVTIGPGVEIYNPGGVFIGHHAIVSQDAYLCGATHDYNTIEFTYLKSPIKLESYSWVCAKAIVLPGVVLKEGSVLGAAGLTSKNLNAWSIYGGNPAKFIKFRVNFLNS